MPKPMGLGRGLDALIPARQDLALPRGAAASEVAVGDIIANPHQPRTRFDDARLSELTESIREHGVIQPLIVMRSVAKDAPPYTLIAGERRWRAAQQAGLKKVPVVIKDVSPQQMLELALIENIQRADLGPIEEALAYQQLAQDFDLTHEQIAQRVGRSRVAVTNTLRLLKLPERIQQLVLDGTLSEGHARVVLMLDSAVEQTVLADEVARKGLSVRQTEELARRMAAPRKAPKAPEEPPRFEGAKHYEGRLRSALGTKVGIQRSRKGGRIVIEFFSDEEFKAIYGKIVGDD